MIERKRWKQHLHKCIVDLVLMLLNARSSQRWGCKQRKGTDIELTTWCIEIIIGFIWIIETTRENKDQIDFRVLRGCLVVVVGVVTQTPQILWSLAHFYHARQPTTNKKNTWPQKLLLTKASHEGGNPRNSVELILQKHNQRSCNQRITKLVSECSFLQP